MKKFQAYTQKEFNKVMYSLQELSKITGISYRTLNVVIYCILIPIFLSLSFYINWKFYRYFKSSKTKK